MDAAMIVKQMKELDFNTKLLVGGGAGYTMPEFKDNAGSASEYVASTTLWVPSVTWPGANDYFNKYKQKYRFCYRRNRRRLEARKSSNTRYPLA